MKRNRIIFTFCMVALVLMTLSACQQHIHSYDKWVVSSAATCSKEGTESRTCSCGEVQTRSSPALEHSYGDWVIEAVATCTEDGVEKRVCECGDAQTQPIPAAGHSYMHRETIRFASCTENGEEKQTCKCGYTQTITLQATGHSYGMWLTEKEATCTTEGTQTRTCKCGEIETKTITTGHKPNSANFCIWCGIECPIELNLTADEIAAARKVQWISERTIDDLEDSQRFRLMFSLKDENENWLTVPVIVKIEITNDKNETVYKATKIVKASDYSTWTNGYGKKWTAAAIHIPYSDITPGSTASGKIKFEVYNDYVSFEASTLSISRNLPLKSSTITLPSLPTVIHDFDYKDNIDSSVKITSISYEINGDDLYIYFGGEKTYDAEGNKYSQSCKVGWKLYDSDGYIIDSGTFYSPAIAVGEKFRNERVIALDAIYPGESYTLVISNVD